MKMKKIYSKKLKVFHTIKFKILISYIITITVSILVLGLISYYKSAEIIESKSSFYLEQLSNQILKNMDREIYELDRISFVTYYNQYIQNALDSNLDFTYDEIVQNDEIIHELFLTTVLSKESTGDVYILSADGKLRFDFVKSYTDRQILDFSGDVKDQEWFRRIVEKNGKMVLLGVDTPIGTSKIKDTFFVARAIRGTFDGKLLGVVMIQESKKAINGILDGIDIGNGGLVFIADETGNLQFSNSKAIGNELYAKVEEDANLKKTIFVNSANNTRVVIQGKTYLILVSTSSYCNWKAISLLPIDEFKKDSNNLKKISYLICIISLAVCILIWVLISNLIINPLISLRKAMKKVETGNLYFELSVSSNDEIGELRNGFNSMIGKLKDLILKDYNSRILMKQAQLDALQSQINPHFLYNILDSIRAEALQKDAVEVSDMIMLLGDMFRYSTSKGGNIVKISDEIKNVENYATLQKFRFEDRIEMEYNIPDEILEYEILRLVLQPIVENAIIHGIEPKMDKGRIKISANLKEEDIVFSISDDGIGIKNADLIHINQKFLQYGSEQSTILGDNIGIYNVNARIKSFYGEKYGIEINSLEGKGTTVVLRIPKKCNNEE